MKKIIMALFLVITSSTVFGQRVMEGDLQVNGGIGLTSGWGVPFYGGVDYGIHDDITVGLQTSFASKTYNQYVSSKWFSIGANGNYHFNTILGIPDEFDVYAGATLAYNNFSNSISGAPSGYVYGDVNSSGIGIGGQVGGRYYFTDNLAANFELGGGNIASVGKLGVSFKF